MLQRPAKRPASRAHLRFWLAWLLLVGSARIGAATFRAGPWQVEVSVTPDQPTVMLGEPAWLSFTVKNLSRENLQILVGGDTANELGRPASFQVKTTRSDGKWVSQPEVGPAEGGLVGPKDLPAGGSQVFRLFMPHWATFTETGTYTITCTRTLQLLRPVADAGTLRKAPTTDVTAEVRTSLTIVSRDAEKMGRRIAELGEAMLRAEGNKPGDEAVITLAWIDDPRVVAYFRRALAIRSYALKFIAVQVMARLATDEALDGLRAATQARAGEFEAESADAQAALAAKIRATAADALSRSKHPRAKEVLAGQRRDEAESVRLVVLHALARLPPAEAQPLVQEMTKDPSARVSEQAKRYLVALWRQK